VCYRVFPLKIIIMLTMALFIAQHSSVAEPATGEYSTKPGWGSITIREGIDGKRHFELFTWGANRHTCDTEGRLEGEWAVPSNEEACRIRFAIDNHRLTVSYETEICEKFCGSRANFEGEYHLLPSGCTETTRKQRMDDFRTDNNNGLSEVALKKMESFDRECKEFLDDNNRDRFANDKALALFNLGRFDSCLKALDTTLVADIYDNETTFNYDRFKELLNEKKGIAIPPSDWAVYESIAHSTWQNRRRCKDALAGQ